MKKLLITISSIITLSCVNETIIKDPKEIAQESNEVKFENTYKEKDALFLVNAAAINSEEILLGELAKHSPEKDIKELGTMMIDGHTKVLNDLTVLALKKSITIPTSETTSAQEAYKMLASKGEADFNREYCALIVTSHTKAIAMFIKQFTETKDTVIKAWTKSTIPYLQIHLNHAIACQNKYGIIERTKQ